MQRRTFLLGLFGGLAAAAGLAGAASTPAEALPQSPVPAPGPDPEAADIKAEDLDGVGVEESRYRRYRRWRRRRVYYYRRPRYYRRRVYFYRPRRRYWRRRYYW